MTKTVEEKEKFIELRARGYSFDRIAEETGTSKNTLLKWSKECSSELEQAQYFELQSLLSQYEVMRRNRVEALSQLLGSSLKELRKRADNDSLSRLQTDKLLNLVLTLEQRIERETEGRKIDLTPLGGWQEIFAEVD